MAKLNFNPYAYDLNRAVHIITRGLAAAEEALTADEQRVVGEIDALKEQIDNGDHPGYQVDGEWNVIDDPFEFHNYDLETIDETRGEMRKAMLIALYHAWERVARDMTGLRGNDNHAAIKEAMAAEGITLTDGLDHLRKLVNLVKHNSEQKMAALWDVRKDLFIDGFDPQRHFPHDWNNALRVTMHQVNEFIEAVVASGPIHEQKQS